jgi:hypothetical protein
MADRRKSRLTILALLLSTLLIATASAAIYFQITADMTFEAEYTPVVFTNGSDTSACGGDTVTNNASVTFSSIPIAIGSNITITELVNLTNSDTSTHSVKITVSSKNFTSSLSVLLLYLVAPNETETLVVKIDDSGTVVTEGVDVNIPDGEEWAIKLIGCYDIGTSGSVANEMKLNVQVTR